MAEQIPARFPWLLPTPPLKLHSVSDRGVPDKERVYLKANSRVNLGEYLLLIGWFLPAPDAIPITDNLFWFGNHVVEAGHWIVVYTGPGHAPLSTTIQGTNEPAVVLHWGKKSTVFESANVIPVLVHIEPGSVQFGR